MANQSTNDSNLDFSQLLREDSALRRFLSIADESSASNVHNEEESPLSASTTPDPLNTAFLNETNVVEQHSQTSLSQPMSQTTREASLTIHGLIGTIVEQEHETIDLRSPVKTMVSTGTMPRTPTMKSTGTMPRTPTMKSTGTMPKTPTMKSTGTMPQTPTTAAAGASFSVSSSQTIDLRSPTIPTIDLISPTIGTVDLCSPEMPATSTSSPQSLPQLPPQ